MLSATICRLVVLRAANTIEDAPAVKQEGRVSSEKNCGWIYTIAWILAYDCTHKQTVVARGTVIVPTYHRDRYFTTGKSEGKLCAKA